MSYLRTSDQPAQSGMCGGLIVWDDLDDDGTDDVVVAGSRQTSGSMTDRGWVEAWSLGTGRRLWQASGVSSRKVASGELEPGYILGQIAKIADVDGDGIADVYCRQKAKSLVLIFSGKTGQLVERHDTDRKGCYIHPIRAQDVDGDNTQDLWFVSGREPRLAIHTARDREHLRDLEFVWPGAGERQRLTIAVADFTDVTGDGISELLGTRLAPNPQGGRVELDEMAVFDGRDLHVLHQFQTPHPRVTGETSYAAPGDLTGDGRPDVIMASSTGEGAQHSTSFLQLIDGSNGQIVWKTLGDLAGGVREFAVDVKTGKRTDLPPDIEFGGPVLITPDVSGDHAVDLATACRTKGGLAGAIFVFSGRDGKLLGTIAPAGDGVRLQGSSKSQLALLKRTKSGVPSIVAEARNSEGKTVLVVLELPKR